MAVSAPALHTRTRLAMATHFPPVPCNGRRHALAPRRTIPPGAWTAQELLDSMRFRSLSLFPHPNSLRRSPVLCGAKNGDNRFQLWGEAYGQSNILPNAGDHPLFYVGVYGAIGFGTALVTVVSASAEKTGAYHAGQKLFKQVFMPNGFIGSDRSKERWS